MPVSNWKRTLLGQTTAWCNETAYLQECRNAGIKHPVGMCYQDAGWKNGPWLGSGDNTKNNSIYVRWRDYIENISIGKTDDNWYFSQEDMHVNLMWGSQVLQKIAQEVRTSENKIVMAEKMSAMAHWENEYSYKQAELDEAWRTLMLSQHHDSWIVPYNRLDKSGTWADAIKHWTGCTNKIADEITDAAMQSYEEGQAYNTNMALSERYIRVYNTLGTKRREMVSVILPSDYIGSDLEICNWKKKSIGYSLERKGGKVRLLFMAEVPPFGYSTYLVRKTKSSKKAFSGDKEHKKVSGREYVFENDMYKIVFDLSKGGIIKSLIAKKEGNKEFARNNGEYSLGEMRGYFYEEGKFHSSTEAPVRMTILSNNEYETRIQVEGEIATHPFTQVITLVSGQKRIDFDLTVNWKNNVGIGEYEEKNWRDNRRAYCDDRFKLSVLFPVDLRSPRIYKNAPFDVCESKLDNTFFNTWDQIKHNVILNW